MDQIEEISLPNNLNFLVSNKNKTQNMKSSKKSLSWTTRRRQLKAESSKNNIIKEIATYIGKLLNQKKVSGSRAMNRTLIKSKGRINKEQDKQNTILYYFKYK